jgi:hypothetical protein
MRIIVMFKQIATGLLAVSFNMCALADNSACPAQDPTVGGSHSAFNKAFLIIGSSPQFPGVKGGVICAYEANTQGNAYPCYSTAPALVDGGNWTGSVPVPFHPSYLMYTCSSDDRNQCQFVCNANPQQDEDSLPGSTWLTSFS